MEPDIHKTILQTIQKHLQNRGRKTRLKIATSPPPDWSKWSLKIATTTPNNISWDHGLYIWNENIILYEKGIRTTSAHLADPNLYTIIEKALTEDKT